ncbi:MAG TPA: ABC transporter permease [Candidatus Paceibacterota bacterium]|nr:ABC transporter permease [Verrucomicrobiota bacterium]HRY48103.1 ABC transporter permease [Candidatus Paceibacterota bacterium]HSA00646.1 ABC transporter permease [Candidatus Paceibacterota bacterium]
MRLNTEIRESFLMAMGALTAHKLRSGLTLLGILVGVFSIIVVMTAMRALQNVMETELSQLGANTFQIQKWPAMPVGGPDGWEKYWRRQNLRYPLVQQLRDRATLAQSVGASSWLWSGEAVSRFEKTNPNVGMVGVTPEVFDARNWVVEEGRALMTTDLDSARNVCVLGNQLAKLLFPHSSPLHETIKFNGIKYIVVGVLEAKGGMVGGDQDRFLAVPLTTGLNRYSWYRSLEIVVQAKDQASFDDTIEQVRGVLRSVRKVPPGKEDDFDILSNDSLITQFRSITFAVRIGVAAVSSIALLTAGVGIMNIMLVSVTERTREIGIRRAIGARKRNIMSQFIMEAIALCQVGGVAGVVLGVLGGNLAAVYLKVPVAIPLDWVGIGLGICCLVGLVFGTYPAYKAANLDPIESLRYE